MAPHLPPRRAFLDIRIGDPAARAEEEEAHARAVAFVREKAGELGLDPATDTPTPIAELEDWQKEMVSDLYAADPAWSAKIQLDPLAAPRGGRLIFELDIESCPKATANFASLCTGAAGYSKHAKTKPLHFKHTPLHRIIRNYIAQGSDITRGDGSGGDSIYSGAFKDEPAGLKTGFACGRGVLAMANSGKHSNTSQWFVTLTDDKTQLKKMEGKYVVFGHLIEGFDVLDGLNAVGSESGTPTEQVQVWDCGVL
ncbi:cyclophilin [Geranomyces variabilis]|nr:cyclophilin [Geranomyces variabilis]